MQFNWLQGYSSSSVWSFSLSLYRHNWDLYRSFCIENVIYTFCGACLRSWNRLLSNFTTLERTYRCTKIDQDKLVAPKKLQICTPSHTRKTTKRSSIRHELNHVLQTFNWHTLWKKYKTAGTMRKWYFRRRIVAPLPSPCPRRVAFAQGGRGAIRRPVMFTFSRRRRTRWRIRRWWWTRRYLI